MAASTHARPFGVWQPIDVALEQLTPHAPAVHEREPLPPPVIGSVQAFAQSPQCSTLVPVSTHWPPQFVSPVAQDVWQDPLEQTSFWPHGLSHLPQCALSLDRLTHSLPQVSSPELQEIEQAPSWQTGWPFAGRSQALSHFPQSSTDV